MHHFLSFWILAQGMKSRLEGGLSKMDSEEKAKLAASCIKSGDSAKFSSMLSLDPFVVGFYEGKMGG